MRVTQHTRPIFTYNGNAHRVIDITWSKDESKDIEPTIVYVDEHGENQSINSGKGELIIEALN